MVAVHRSLADKAASLHRAMPALCAERVFSACRRAIPLALALLNVSSPTLGAMDALSRLSHDTDAEVAQNAVMALGVLPAAMHVPQLTQQACIMSNCNHKRACCWVCIGTIC